MPRNARTCVIGAIRLKYCLLILLGAVAIGIFGLSLVRVEAQSGRELRVQARALPNGRIEFAVQVRDDDSWSKRTLPKSRWLFPDVDVDRWYVSQKVTLITSYLRISAAGNPVNPQHSLIRIAARRLADGRVEFALQGSSLVRSPLWRVRILPDLRFVPAEPPTSRWLSSSPVAALAVARAPFPGAERQEAVRAAEQRCASGRTFYEVWYHSDRARNLSDIDFAGEAGRWQAAVERGECQDDALRESCSTLRSAYSLQQAARSFGRAARSELSERTQRQAGLYWLLLYYNGGCG